MSSVDYKKWADYNYNIIKSYLPNKPFALELAAGDCSHAFYFHKYISNIVVSDLSYSMLSNSKIKFTKTVVADMKNLPFKQGIFDFVISSFDSINYLTSKKKLRQAFREVNRVLKKDGIFEFDVSLELNSRNILELLNRKGIINGIKYEQKSFFLEKSRIHKNILFFFDENGVIYEEIHKQKIYKLVDYFEELASSGFVVLKCLETFTYKNADENRSERATFVVRKTNK